MSESTVHYESAPTRRSCPAVAFRRLAGAARQPEGLRGDPCARPRARAPARLSPGRANRGNDEPSSKATRNPPAGVLRGHLVLRHTSPLGGLAAPDLGLLRNDGSGVRARLPPGAPLAAGP